MKAFIAVTTAAVINVQDKVAQDPDYQLSADDMRAWLRAGLHLLTSP